MSARGSAPIAVGRPPIKHVTKRGWILKAPPARRSSAFKRNKLRFFVLDGPVLSYFENESTSPKFEKGQVLLCNIFSVLPDKSKPGVECSFIIKFKSRDWGSADGRTFKLTVAQRQPMSETASLKKDFGTERENRAGYLNPAGEMDDWINALRLEVIHSIYSDTQQLLDFLVANKLLEDSLDSTGRSLIFRELELGNEAVVREILKLAWGSDAGAVLLRRRVVNAQDHVTGKTMLHYCAECGYYDLSLDVLALSFECDVSIRDAEGHDSLHYAIAREDWDLGARILKRDISYAYQSVKNEPRLLTNPGLRLAGFDVNVSSVNGETLMSLARAEKNLEIIDLLQQCNFDEELAATPPEPHSMHISSASRRPARVLQHVESIADFLTKGGRGVSDLDVGDWKKYLVNSLETLRQMDAQNEANRLKAQQEEEERFRKEMYDLTVAFEADMQLMNSAILRKEMTFT